MVASLATALAANSAGGAKLRSSRRRSANSGCFASDIQEFYLQCRPSGLMSSRQRGETRADRRDQVGVRKRSVLQERPVVLDGRRAITALVGDDSEVVMRARAAGIDRDRAPE